MIQPTWKPLFTGRPAEPYARLIDDIVEAVDRHEVADIDWGRPLLHTYLAEARGAAAYRTRAVELVDRATAAIEHHLHMPALYGGFSGVAWLAAHTDRFFDRESDDAYDDIDEALLTFVDRTDPIPYDLIVGLVGIGVYFVERLPRSGAAEALNSVLRALVARAENSDDRSTWFTSPEMLHEIELETTPDGYYNLGVAHGVPGVLGLLGEMCRARVGGSAAETLLRRAARWTLSQRLPDGGFPSMLAREIPRASARAAWCYGGLGLSVALLSAARALDDASLESEAIEIALACAARRENAGVMDAGLCHGSAGNAHLFNRLFQATDRAEFRDAACYWFDYTLGLRVDGDGVAGYRPYRAPRPRHNFQPDPTEKTSFLTGASGIALACLAATSPVAPDWDRLLLSRLEPLGSRSANGESGDPSR